jgi:hypothetical protein
MTPKCAKRWLWCSAKPDAMKSPNGNSNRLRGSVPALALLVSFFSSPFPAAVAQSPANLFYRARVSTGQRLN